MKEALKRLWSEHPLLVIVLLAILPRLIAAIFSRGYAMHDDHFGPIEQPFIIQHYLTYWTGRVEPHGHSIIYPSIHFGLFSLFKVVGVQDPQTTMLFVRLIHSAYSLLIVVFGYKIAEVLSDRETAKKTGLVLALFWALPFLGVRNLIETVCIPPLMAGFYYALVSPRNLRHAFTAGLWFGLAFVFRYQTLLITATVVLVFLTRRQYREMMWTAVGFLLLALVIQGTADILAWGYPFASLIEYVRYNAAHGTDYTTGPWYNYTLLVVGALIPPMSLFLVFSFLRSWRKAMVIVVPVLVFFLLHSYFPNKQERFILPVLPPILLLGVMGWVEFVQKSGFWTRHRTAARSLWMSFWAFNLVMLILFSTYYGKRSRIEAMYSLYGKSPTGLVLEGGVVGTSQPPFFYSGVYPVPFYEVNNDQDLAAMKEELRTIPVRFSHVIFFGVEDLDRRVAHIESELGLKLGFENRFEPSFLDVVFYKLNPKHNKNEVTCVYKVSP